MKRFALVTCLAVLLALTVRGEVNTATDYFNLGAATFIRENPEQALAIVNEGLLFFPEDETLLRLKALIEQQDQDNQSSSSSDSESQDRDDSNEQPPEDEDQSEQSPEEQDEPWEEPPDDEKNQQDASEDQRQEQPGDMNEDEAEMVLDSLRQLEEAQRERIMQDMIRRQMQNMPPVEKDW